MGTRSCDEQVCEKDRVMSEVHVELDEGVVGVE